jgi:histidinol dehydrogenase
MSVKLYSEGTVKFDRALSGSVAGSVKNTVAGIIERVRSEGDAALIDLTRKFDGFDPGKKGLKVERDEMQEAWKRVTGKMRKSLEKMAGRIIRYSTRRVAKYPC